MKPHSIQNIAIDRIKASGTRRAINPNWVAALANSISEIGLISPIEVYETIEGGEGYLLVLGGHRLAAVQQLGWASIPASVLTSDDLREQSTLKQHEISENLVRNNLTALDRAFDIAEWRDLYVATHAINKGGRPKTVNFGEWEEKQTASFAQSFSEAAKAALGISERSIVYCLKIASIGEGIRQRIALHSVADNQSELLLLAAQQPYRQTRISDLLLRPEGEGIASVSVAIALLDGLELPAKPERWTAFSNKFSKMKQTDQFRFFEANSAAIELWMKAR